MEQLGHFRILSRIGAGGMGEVYRARDEKLQRDVAIKVLPASSFGDSTARARLLREARAAAALNHPNICTIFDVGEAGDQGYIAMECVDGQPLDQRIAGGALSSSDVIRYGIQLADALAHAHDRGIVHRDLKPGNVIVTPENRLKVLDFGLAKKVEEGKPQDATTTPNLLLTEPGTVLGTPAYMAPEQLHGHPADARSDIWALGVILYEMTSGARPFGGQTWPELSVAILTQPPSALAARVPLELQTVISRCLAKQPGDRFQRAGELRAALETIQTGIAPVPMPHETPPTIRTGITRRRAIRLAAAVFAAVAVLVTVWRFWPAAVPRYSLAVLPMVNALNDPAVDYLCDGLTETLIHHVSRLESVRVSPRSAVFNFKGRANVIPREAGRQLGVDSVLAGSLASQRGRLTIEVQLVDVATDRVLWNRKYDRPSGDFIRVQSDLASAMVEEGLHLRTTTEERQQLVRNPTNDPEAYDLAMQARYLQRRATGDDYLNARDLLQRAIVRDPNFAEAYVWLGGIHAMMAVDGLERPTDAWPQSNRYMRKALDLNPTLTTAHVLAHAQACFFDWDWAGAERERKIVLAASPAEVEPTAMRAFALERWALGHPDEALQLIRRMRELDRLSPDLIRLEADYLLASGQGDAAIALYEKAIRTDPNDPHPYFGLADGLFRQRRFDEAIEARRHAHAAADDTGLDGVLKSARGEAGYRAIERRWIEIQLEALKTAEGYVSPLDFASVYAQSGDAEQAFRHLEAAFADRSPGLVFLNVDRAWDGIRNDPRFQGAVRRVGLP